APKWIILSDIQSRKFSDETGEFLLELALSNITTVFESEIHVPSHGVYRGTKMETGYFTFGSFDWSLSIVVNDDDNDDAKPTVYLNRLTSFDNPCRVQYRVVIGDGKHREDSGLLDQISDMSGRIRGFDLHYYSISDLLKYNHNTIVVYVEMHCANTISEAKVPIARNTSPAINCYDRNKQGWCIEADVENEFLRLKLFFMDLHSVPRNHLRYISWITYVVTKDSNTGTRESIPVNNIPHSNYYVTDGVDMGVIMDTDIYSRAIQVSPKDYLEMEGHLTVHIEWVDSILLFNNLYHKYDDLARIHSHQMRREVTALQAENYSLERQLFSYQKSISMVSARAQRGTDAYGLERNPYNS
ncbi:uncharacterized protein B4U80_08312, partial [Leptotrombidium deliense]